MNKGRRTSKQEEQLTREALADVDAGDVIDHHVVQAWALSLVPSDPRQTPRRKTK
ncbi:hypothetical protein [Mesorhizobium sp.]|uniref:hypothetical protein n=1 Tax=Mesorhizobium sp. TaxID=1871066 RepID=UPI003F91B336